VGYYAGRGAILEVTGRSHLDDDDFTQTGAERKRRTAER
jgi:hypothetical protein